MATTPAKTTPRPLVPPRGPTDEEWQRMSRTRRDGLEEELLLAAIDYEEAQDARLSYEERAAMAEGDFHSGATYDSRAALRAYFERKGSRLYIAANLPVYYPGETYFAPDLFAVRDVPVRKRDSYIVRKEGKGIDLAIENLWKGKRKKDLVDNVARYARLGIPEYFVIDIRKGRIHAYHLAEPDVRRYTPMLGDRGRYHSEVLGLDLTLSQGELRFYSGTAIVPLLDEIVHAAQEAAVAAQEAAVAAQEAAVAAQDLAQAEMRQVLLQAIVTIFRARGLPVTAEQEERIGACQDLALLRRWLDRASTAAPDALFLDA